MSAVKDSDPGRLRRDPALPFQEVEGRAVVVVPGRREVHQLDEVGTFVWSALGQSRSFEELVRAVCAEFDVSEEGASKDLRPFLAELKAKGLLL